MAAGDGYLVTADFSGNRLYFYSIADPSDPKLATGPRAGSLVPAAGLAIADGRLWVSGGDLRLEVYTLGDFSSPEKYVRVRDWHLAVAYDITAGPHGFYLSAQKDDNTHAVVPFDTDLWPDLQLRSDVSMPEPLSDHMPTVWRDNVLYGISSSYVSVMAATHPADLELSRRLDLGRALVGLTTEEEGYLLVSSADGGLTLVDVRDPLANIAGIPDPRVVARLAPSPGGYTQLGGLAARGRLLYAAGAGTAGLQIYALGPYLPPPVSPTPTPTGTPSATPTPTPTPRSADLNRDGVVDQYDLLLLLGQGRGTP